MRKVSTEGKPILVYLPDATELPVTITELSGSSTGTRKPPIAAFDLTYDLFTIENLIHTPRFVVHDCVGSVVGEDLWTVQACPHSDKPISPAYPIALTFFPDSWDTCHFAAYT